MKTIRCFRPENTGDFKSIFIDDVRYAVWGDGSIKIYKGHWKTAEKTASRGDTEITASELAADFAGQPKTVAEIWRLVEEAEGCRCWVDADPFYRIYAGDKMVCFFADSHEFHHESPHVFTEECAIDCSYHRISLAEVLSAVKDNESLTKQILEFVGEPVKEYATSFPTEFAEAVTKALADEPVEASPVEEPVKTEPKEKLYDYMFLADKCEHSYSCGPWTMQKAEAYARGLCHGKECDVEIYVKIRTVKYEQ